MIAVATASCAVEDCDSPSTKRGWCNAHYIRWRRHGDPVGGGLSHGALPTWLREAVARDTDACIEWPYSTRSDGYGALRHEGRIRPAHQVALILVGRQPPGPGEDTRHLCGVRLCVNPRHLEVGTRAENEADKVAQGRTPRGDRHWNARLTAADVRAIRASTAPRRVLAERYGISPTNVTNIRKRHTWTWLDHEEGTTHDDD